MISNRSLIAESAMARLAVILCALLLLSSASFAQRSAKPPLTISDDTIGALGDHQVGSIILPQGAPPYPAVVVLHGCNGVSQATRAWTRRLASWGYAVLLIDSFTSRGIENVCGRGMELSGRE